MKERNYLTSKIKNSKKVKQIIN